MRIFMQCGPNKKTLRHESMLLRSLDTSPEQKKENVRQSVEVAKKALMLDLKDGQSWYLLGNAYLSDFFVNMKRITELDNAVKAYNEAVRLCLFRRSTYVTQILICTSTEVLRESTLSSMRKPSRTLKDRWKSIHLTSRSSR